MIEAGFAASSNGDFDAVKSIANAVKNSTVCLLARANDRDISRAAEALQGAKSKRIHTFIATSALHMEKKLRMSPSRCTSKRNSRYALRVNLPTTSSSRRKTAIARARLSVSRAGSRDRRGATTINIPDTVGYAVPELYGQFLRMLRERVPNSDKAIWSVHCHNDLGMAVANSLAGVMIGGARQVECTINGLGERAGNCSLEEVVMAVRTRRDFSISMSASTRRRSSPLQSWWRGLPACGAAEQGGRRRKCVWHASGIHQDGVLKARDTYEIMRAEDVGWSAEDRARQAVWP